MPFNQVAIVGCGLIGGSFALGLKKQGFTGEIVGCDREDVLAQAKERGAIDRGITDLRDAVADADLVYLSTPVGTILELLPEVGKAAKADALITDTGSTKAAICAQAQLTLPPTVSFLGGHPMAGKEVSGVENADADLFAGAKYAVIRDAAAAEKLAESEFLSWIRKLGAEPVELDAPTHDWAVAFVSHLPQLLSTALAGAVWDETDEDRLPVSLAAGGFRDMVRLAGSPYELWRDICSTNKINVARALERMERRLARLRERLTSRELAVEFERAQELHAMLKERKGRSGNG